MVELGLEPKSFHYGNISWYSPLLDKRPGREQTPWSLSHRLHFPAQHVEAWTPGGEREFIKPSLCFPVTSHSCGASRTSSHRPSGHGTAMGCSYMHPVGRKTLVPLRQPCPCMLTLRTLNNYLIAYASLSSHCTQRQNVLVMNSYAMLSRITGPVCHPLPLFSK